MLSKSLVQDLTLIKSNHIKIYTIQCSFELCMVFSSEIWMVSRCMVLRFWNFVFRWCLCRRVLYNPHLCFTGFCACGWWRFTASVTGPYHDAISIEDSDTEAAENLTMEVRARATVIAINYSLPSTMLIPRDMEWHSYEVLFDLLVLGCRILDKLILCIVVRLVTR